MTGKESVEHILFECASYKFQRQNFFDYMKQILTLEAFEAFNQSNVFNKAVFFSGENKVC